MKDAKLATSAAFDVVAFNIVALERALFTDLALPRTAEFVVAYSGGCDSHALLHAMATLRERTTSRIGFRLSAMHFDHALMRESDAWAKHCQAVCRELGVEFLSACATENRDKEQKRERTNPSRESTEMFARRIRYQWFCEVLTAHQILLTAHHANDQAETLLLNLLRGGSAGASLEALAGIPPLRFLSGNHGARVARPLLTFSRTALRAYAMRHSLHWVEDPSNRDSRFARNHIRNEFLPQLEKRWQHAVTSLATSAHQCREIVDFIHETLNPLLTNCATPRKMGVFCLTPPLSIAKLRPLGRALTIRALRHWLHQHGCRSPSAAQFTTFYQQVFSRATSSASLNCTRATLRSFSGHLYLTARLDGICTRANFTTPSLLHNLAIDWNMRSGELGNSGIRVEVTPVRTTSSSINNAIATGTETRPNPTTINLHALNVHQLHGKSRRFIWRQGGERIILPGHNHHSKLKKLFQQSAVPPWERNALPLLVVEGEVAWAHGIGASATYRYTAGQAGINLRFVPLSPSN